MEVSWPSLVCGVPAAWPSGDRSRRTFSVAFSLKFPHHLNAMSLYWHHGYIDIQLENTLKDRRKVMWSFCLPWRVTSLEKISPKFPLLFFFPSPNIFTKYWISLRHSYTWERQILVSLMPNYALLLQVLFFFWRIAQWALRTLKSLQHFFEQGLQHPNGNPASFELG